METQLSTIRDFSEVSWDEQTKRWSSYVWVHFILIRCFSAMETCKWLKQPEIGMCIIISSKLPVIMHNLLLFGEHKMQGVILIPESININLA